MQALIQGAQASHHQLAALSVQRAESFDDQLRKNTGYPKMYVLLQEFSPQKALGITGLAEDYTKQTRQSASQAWSQYRCHKNRLSEKFSVFEVSTNFNICFHFI